MNGKQYRAHKDNTIDLFNGYVKKRGDMNDGIDVNILKKRVESLKKGKFTLAVAGEVKAGKSTFINALLGTEILPADVLQTSSAIVEIYKSDISFLKVEYADGGKESLQDDQETVDIDEANVRLHEICKIHDKYRHIPTTLIDDYIIENEGKLVVNKELVKLLEQQSGESLIANLDVIKEYVSGRTMDKIPVKIEFGYPLKWDFDELRIVDSPGVNATGGVQSVSLRYFEEANAIVFLHRIEPIESESFKNFVNSVISNRSKDTLFLVLTHAAKVDEDDEVERLHTEALRLYRNIIPKDRILVVDSLLKLIHCDLEKGISVEEIKNKKFRKKILSSYIELAKDEDRTLLDVVLEGSRFEKMFNAINQFSLQAPKLQLQEILEQIKRGYEEQELQYGDKVGRLDLKKKNPQEFKEEINRISHSLEEFRKLSDRTKDDIKGKFSGKHSQWNKEIDSIKIKYPELINSSVSVDTTKKHLLDSVNAIEKFLEDISKELVVEFNEALLKAGKQFQTDYNISIPKVDLNAMSKTAADNSYRDKDVYKTRKKRLWYTLWIVEKEFKHKVGTKKVFDDKMYLEKLQKMAHDEFYDRVNKLPRLSKNIVNNYSNIFKKEMDLAINERQKELKNEEDKLQTNSEIMSEIEKTQTKKKDLQKDKKKCTEILVDII